MRLNTRLLYGPTLFEASTTAAEHTSQIGPWYEFAVPCQCARAGPWQPVSNFAQDLGRANFILDNWIELANQVHNEAQHKTVVWADAI